MSGDPLFKYYDRIFLEKDYKGEAQIVLDVLREQTPFPVKRLLDVGCGTGCHALEFSQHNISVLGVDLDPMAISIATSKAGSAALDFICGPIESATNEAFDGATSLFHVINYLIHDEQIESFFQGIYNRLKPGGGLVFDCWNGVAALNSPPRIKETEIQSDIGLIKVKLTPELNRNEKRVDMAMTVTVEKDGEVVDTFTHTYIHRLWTPDELSQILRQVGFSQPRVVRWMEPDVVASDDDWKIMFMCKRGTE